jgi:hypothetical protein
MPIDPEYAKRLRDKETQDGEAGHLIEQALDSVRAAHWPTLDPNLEMFRKGKC